jgi:hypothetical protein
MSLSNLTVSQTYTGDGTTTSYAIPFALLANSQVKVKKIDTLANTEGILVVGTDYTVTGGNPGTHVALTVAPLASDQVVVYRETTLTQDADYLAGAVFPAETHEKALDKMVMMIQELSYKLSNTTPGSLGGTVELTPQALAPGDTILVSNSNAYLVKKVAGSGGATAINLIEDGDVAWQELRLVGTSDDDPIALTGAANLVLNGTKVLSNNVVLELIWDNTDNVWREI